MVSFIKIYLNNSNLNAQRNKVQIRDDIFVIEAYIVYSTRIYFFQILSIFHGLDTQYALQNTTVYRLK